MKNGNSQSVNSSVIRALDMLELLITTPNALSIAEICRKLDLNRVTCVNMLNTLMSKRYVYKNADGHYVISGKIYVMAMLYRESFPIIEPFNIIACDAIKDLNCIANLTVVADLDKALVLSQVPDAKVYTSAAAQLYYPLYCTANGKVLLAHQPAKRIDTVLETLEPKKYTEHTVVDKDAIRRELSITRERGYGLDYMEYYDNTICIGAPVFGKNGQVAFAVSFTEIKLDEEHTIDWYVPRIIDLAKALSYTIGYRNKSLDIF